MLNKRLLKTISMAILIIILAFGIRLYLGKQEQLKAEEQAYGRREKVFAPMVEEDNRILQYFKKEYPNREVILACLEDITDDQLDDLLVIYREDNNIRLVAVCDKGDGSYYITPEIPAPVENQTIQFVNIDKEAEMEFIVSGEKKGAVGYAIYRIIDGEIIDLFGQGMEDCC